MRRLIVRYKVKPDRVDENIAYIEKVFEQLASEQPTGFRYASFRLDDGLSFVHIVFEEPAGGGRSLADFEAFRAFTANIAERCDEPPVAAELTEIGSYRFLD